MGSELGKYLPSLKIIFLVEKKKKMIFGMQEVFFKIEQVCISCCFNCCFV